MAPQAELDSQAVVVTSALLGPQGLALLAPLVTKDRRAFREALGSQASQVPRAKQEKSCPYLVPQEQKDFRGLPVSKGPKVTEVFLGPREGQASLERRALWASQGLDFQGLLVPKASMVYLEILDLLGFRVAKDSMAYLATQVCPAKRESLELVCQDSKACQDFPAFPAHPGRRETSGDQAFPGSMVQSAPRAFRESEVTQDRLDCKGPKEPQESPE